MATKQFILFLHFFSSKIQWLHYSYWKTPSIYSAEALQYLQLENLRADLGLKWSCALGIFQLYQYSFVIKNNNLGLVRGADSQMYSHEPWWEVNK